MKEDGRKSPPRESDFYEPVKNALDSLLREACPEFHLEITATGNYSNKMKAQIGPGREIVFRFLQGAIPDIWGFIKREFFSDVIIAEIKNEEIKLDHIYQTRKYAELFNAKFSLLVSTFEIPQEIKILPKAVNQLLAGSSRDARTTLAFFNPATNTFEDWFEKNPFVKPA